MPWHAVIPSLAAGGALIGAGIAADVIDFLSAASAAASAVTLGAAAASLSLARRAMRRALEAAAPDNRLPPEAVTLAAAAGHLQSLAIAGTAAAHWRREAAARIARDQDSRRHQKEALACLEATMESTPNGLLVVDGAGGAVLHSNPAFAKLFQSKGGGSPPVDSGAGAWIASRTDDPSAFLQHWRRAAAEPSADLHFDIALPDGRICHTVSAPVLREDGVPFARLWSFQDLTGRHRMESQLRELEKMEAVGRLAGGMAHDFNNLLSAIIGSVDLARSDTAPAEGEPSPLDQAAGAARRGAELVRQLLGFSRRAVAVLESCDLNEIVRGAAAMLEDTRHPGRRLEVETAPRLWPVLVDPRHVERVIVQLGMNAMASLPPGGGTVRLRTSARPGLRLEVRGREKSGDFLCISVGDNGSGISPENQPLIFEPFFTTHAETGGHGLGLPMAYGIAAQHGGWIEFDSTPGQGSEFRLFLPAEHNKASRDTTSVPQSAFPSQGSPRPAPPAAPAPAPPPAGDGSVFLVDDDPLVRQVTCAILRASGFVVHTADSGPAALRLLAAGPLPSVIVLDLSMPGMTGEQTFLALRDRGIATAVIFYSGYGFSLAEFASRHTVENASFLPKPFEPGDLVAMINRHLNRRSAVSLVAVEV